MQGILKKQQKTAENPLRVDEVTAALKLEKHVKSGFLKREPPSIHAKRKETKYA